ncbi:scavenger receptor cysteine-rich type 1 protein M130-like [Hemitrygon akajei]|uniref:scavenger receptor cysteine-rich type 1 protein M130-like n=1 Tax=Hemitrygon akajei TaxID=2704970 RepID=UPI003BF99A7E
MPVVSLFPNSSVHQLAAHGRFGDCQPDPSESVTLRLANGGSRCDGRLEIHYKGNWGTVNGNSWDMPDANVVCRQLGCGTALKAYDYGDYGKGSGPIFTTNVQCGGSEAALQECKSDPWGDTGYSHSQDAGVVCKESRKLRLEKGDSPCTGRLEVNHEGYWRPVGADGWDLLDATVVCRELSCGAALKAPHEYHFGKFFEFIITYNVTCDGTEPALRECKSAEWNYYNHPRPDYAGVICAALEYRVLPPRPVLESRVLPPSPGLESRVLPPRPVLLPFHVQSSPGSGVPARVKTQVPDHRAPRLVSGNDECSGRLEVQFGDTWKTVCDLHWDMKDANVVCSQLQCGVVVAVRGGAYFGEGTGQVSTHAFECQGNHEAQLVDGNNRCSGRVEVRHGDQWGTLCDEYLSLEDAAVVCEQLQCGAVNATPRDAYFGTGNGSMWKDDYICLGNESRLADCQVSAWSQISCSHGDDASLICTDDIWSLRLTDGGSRCDGQVEVYDNGRWSRIQDNFWNINETNVVCNQLRCGVATSSYIASGYRGKEGPVWVTDLQCEGSESHLQNCRTSILNRSSSDIIGVGVLCSGE